MDIWPKTANHDLFLKHVNRKTLHVGIVAWVLTALYFLFTSFPETLFNDQLLGFHNLSLFSFPFWLNYSHLFSVIGNQKNFTVLTITQNVRVIRWHCQITSFQVNKFSSCFWTWAIQPALCVKEVSCSPLSWLMVTTLKAMPTKKLPPWLAKVFPLLPGYELPSLQSFFWWNNKDGSIIFRCQLCITTWNRGILKGGP